MRADQEVKLTKARISAPLCTIINRLSEGHPVKMEDIMATPEMRLGQQVLAECPKSTMNLDQSVREPLHNGILNKISQIGSYNGTINVDGKEVPQYDGPVAYGKQLHIVMGMPASGKSSGLVDVISKEFSAQVCDNDTVKEMIPEFWEGWGSGAVHEESKMLSNIGLNQSMSLGKNVVVPKLGCPPESLKEIMQCAEKYGYQVNVHMMEVEPSKAVGRLLSRFVETGRYIDPQFMNRFIEDPTAYGKAFEEIKSHSDGYSVWTNNVERGERPILKEYGGTVSGDFIREARTDIENEQKVIPETAEERDMAFKQIHDAVIDETINQTQHHRTAEASKIVRLMESKYDHEGADHNHHGNPYVFADGFTVDAGSPENAQALEYGEKAMTSLEKEEAGRRNFDQKSEKTGKAGRGEMSGKEFTERYLNDKDKVTPKFNALKEQVEKEDNEQANDGTDIDGPNT